MHPSGFLFLSVILAVLAVQPASAASRWVDAATGNDTGNCANQLAPCKTITYAMSQATGGGLSGGGDSVNVSPGIYDVALGENFPIVVKAGVWLSGLKGAHETIIDASGANQRVLTAILCCNSRISGFTIIGGAHAPPADGSVAEGGGVFLAGSNFLHNNIIRNNEARGYAGTGAFPAGGTARGGGISISGGGEAYNNLIVANTARGGDAQAGSGARGGDAFGGGIYVDGGIVRFNSLHDNDAVGGSGGSSAGTGGAGGNAAGGGIALAASSTAWANILSQGLAAAGTGGAGASPGAQGTGAAGGLFEVSAGSATIRDNLYHANVATGSSIGGDSLGVRAVTGDPLFHRPPERLRIRAASPARAKVQLSHFSPFPDFDGRQPPLEGLSYYRSIGAYEPSAFPGDATDADRDRRSDVLWRNGQSGEVWISMMNGLAVMGGALPYVEPDTAWTIVANADFNADGYTDLLWRNGSTGQVFMMLLGPGTVPVDGRVIHVEPSPHWRVVATPDFDGDGKADIVWWNASTGQVWYMRMDGLAVTAQGLLYREPDVNWRIRGDGDFSFAGYDKDLVWQNIATGQLVRIPILYSKTCSCASTGDSQPLYAVASPQWKLLAAADLDADGLSDLVFRNEVTGQVYVVLTRFGQVVGEARIHEEPNLDWSIVAVGDYNGDGRSDLLWRNRTTGHVYLMLMDGLRIVEQGMVYHEPNTSWTILGFLEASP